MADITFPMQGDTPDMDSQTFTRVAHPAQIPEHIVHLSEIFTASGHQIFLVGGCVRDLVLGREPNDYDFSTSATVEEIVQVLEANNLPYDDHFFFLNYVPVIFHQGDEEEKIDVSCFHGNSLWNDLHRRDITINAMAYDIQKGEIIDCTGGLSDMNNRIIRLNRPLNEEKSGDILRVLRFALELDFKIDPATYDALKDAVPFLENIRTSTLTKGMTKLLRGAEHALVAK